MFLYLLSDLETKIQLKMKLTTTALELIDTMAIRMKIGLALNKSESAVRRYIKDNDDNLTKAASLEVIKSETGLAESEILITEKAEA